MSDFYSLVDRNNKIRYTDLKRFMESTRLDDYLGQVGMPFMVGKELFEGDLSHCDDGLTTSTMRFSLSNSETVSKEDAPPANSAITQAVYLLRKCRNSDEPRHNVFSIGRAVTNDITIADYVISRFHAAIYASGGRFFIEDLSSTNGVSINGRKIGRGQRVLLPLESEVSFGRFCFVFTQPLELYRRIRSERTLMV